ncbi:MAG: hypothetical protein AB1589_19895 [Cyanobacteriota bacterium]
MNILLFKILLIPNKFVISPWQNPLLCRESTTQKVVVYYYSSRWVPIMFYNLSNAIALHQKARLEGKELYVFPADFDPNSFNQQDIIPLITSKASQISIILPLSEQLDAIYNQEVAAV